MQTTLAKFRELRAFVEALDTADEEAKEMVLTALDVVEGKVFKPELLSRAFETPAGALVLDWEPKLGAYVARIGANVQNISIDQAKKLVRENVDYEKFGLTADMLT